MIGVRGGGISVFWQDNLAQFRSLTKCYLLLPLYYLKGCGVKIVKAFMLVKTGILSDYGKYFLCIPI